MESLSKRARLEARSSQQRDEVEEEPVRDGDDRMGEASGEGEGEAEEDEEDEKVKEQMKEFFSELDMDSARQKRNLMTEGLRAPRRKSALPSHLYSVMGSANLRLARGDASGAIDLCLEVIRQAPHSAEPYLTLATIYEEMGDTQKLLQILVISAHLKRSDVELWSKAGQLATDLHNLPLAARCYHQACKLEPGDPTHVWNKASTYQLLNEPAKAVGAYQQLLQMLPTTNGRDILQVSKELAQLYYHHCNSPHQAITVLHTAIDAHMTLADDKAIHLLVELYISSKNYQSAYELLITYYNMAPEQRTTPKSRDQSRDQAATPTDDIGPSFQQMLSSAIRVSLSEDTEGMGGEGDGGEEGEGEGEEDREVLEVAVPDDLPVDIRVKLAICLIHLTLPLPPSLLAPVTTCPEEYGDLFMDLAEAYTDMGSPSRALPLLSALVHTQCYGQAGVWLKHAECLHTLQDLEGAAMSYSQVLNLAPHHTDTRLALATIYVQLGRVDDALALLESDQYDHVPIAMDTTEECSNVPELGLIRPPEQTEFTLEGLRVLLHRFNVLVNSGRVSNYVSDGIALLAVLFRDVFHRNDLKSIMHLSAKTLLERMKNKTPNIADSLLSLPEWWSLFLTTCKGLLRMGPLCHKQLLHLVLCAGTLNTTEYPHIEQQFVVFAASLSYMLKEYDLAFSFIRMVCVKLDHPVVWNILNALPLTGRYQKFLLRMCFKHPTNLTLLRIHANYSLATSNYKFALCLYEQSYRQPSTADYLICLCIGVVYFNMATQKGSMGRNQLVLQGMGFLHKYLQLRGKCQESMYNLGRAFHQIGVVHAASHFYRQVLVLEPENGDPKWQLASDLRPEATFNLSHIYIASGNHRLAVKVLSQYCRI